MEILIVTPAAKHSRSGNRATATRWRKIFGYLGHNVTVVDKYQNQPAEVMIAIHAWRSAEAIQQFSKLHPASALVVVLSGTDAYQYINTHPHETLASLQLADQLVGLHSKIYNVIPKEFHKKIRVIYQSAQFLPGSYSKTNNFNVCVAGHLRKEKDPLRPAYAARYLPDNSHITIHHYGKAHSYEWVKKARLEEASNTRYRWHGEVSQSYLREKMLNSDLLALPSYMEGGANIVSEALALNLPVVASRIDGSVGLLGEQYPGYFETGNTHDLCKLLRKAENNPLFYDKLHLACQQRRSLFHPSKETLGWKTLLQEINF
jgi:putative glycosyltransferase (TIGR04348 family)